MAESLSAFMQENVKQIGIKEVQVSDRFVDKDGQPVKWKIKAISADENQKLRKDCTIHVGRDKAGRTIEKRDNDYYQARLAAECVVWPDLRDVNLIENWGCSTAEDLIRRMLSAGEFDKLVLAIVRHCGFKSEDELEEEVKN